MSHADEDLKDRLRVLHELFALDIWNEELMGDLFVNTVETVLYPRERFIVEMKCEGKTDDYIWRILRKSSPQKSLTLASYETQKRTIKQKLKDGFQHTLPGWVRGKIWEDNDG